MYLSIKLINELIEDCRDEDYKFDLQKFLRLVNEYQHNPITLEEAKVLIDDAIFKKDLGLNVIELLCSVINNETKSIIDMHILNNQKIRAIKAYREQFRCGLAEAKHAVEARQKVLGLS